MIEGLAIIYLADNNMRQDGFCEFGFRENMLRLRGSDHFSATAFWASDDFTHFNDHFIDRWLVIQTFMTLVLDDFFLTTTLAGFIVFFDGDNNRNSWQVISKGSFGLLAGFS
jgi:hypothetical protein